LFTQFVLVVAVAEVQEVLAVAVVAESLKDGLTQVQ
jgi:hypothetical protein